MPFWGLLDNFSLDKKSCNWLVHWTVINIGSNRRGNVPFSFLVFSSIFLLLIHELWKEMDSVHGWVNFRKLFLCEYQFIRCWDRYELAICRPVRAGYRYLLHMERWYVFVYERIFVFNRAEHRPAGTRFVWSDLTHPAQCNTAHNNSCESHSDRTKFFFEWMISHGKLIKFKTLYTNQLQRISPMCESRVSTLGSNSFLIFCCNLLGIFFLQWSTCETNHINFTA